MRAVNSTNTDINTYDATAPGKSKRYPWLFFDANRPWFNSLSITVLIILLSIAIFIGYNYYSTDIAPDSVVGYLYAIVGTVCFTMTMLLYTFKRRSRSRMVGALNGSLHWHVSLGTITLVLLLLHSFGNFNPRSGTYALFGMIGIVISGAVGRMLDRFMPRLITKEVSKALTESGEDRLEAVTRTIESIAAYNTQSLRTFRPAQPSIAQPMPYAQPARPTRPLAPSGNPGLSKGQESISLPTPWDLSYISLAETPQEIARDNQQQYRFVPDRKSPLAEPGALIPGLQEHMDELHQVQRALQREQFFRAIIRYWRIFHILLVLLTIGLTLWHLEYAATLLLPVFMKH